MQPVCPWREPWPSRKSPWAGSSSATLTPGTGATWTALSSPRRPGPAQGQGLATLRFNFRGVGGSRGAWDEGRGEQDDVRAALAFLGQRLSPTAALALAGYSFGASMAARVAAGSDRLAGLALIAPPLASPGWQPLSAFHVEGPILLVAGRDDQYCPPDALAALGRMIPAATIIVVDGTDHFFFTALEALASAVAGWAGRIKR